MNKVIDVSIGVIYARKKFYVSQLRKSEKRRRQQKKDWLNQVRKEIRIMRQNSHVSLINCEILIEADRSKEKHHSCLRFSRELSILFSNALSFSRNPRESSQRKSHC
jgi:gluconate kinase